MGGTKMRTLGRLFNSFEQETVNDGDQGGETNVGRYFNFPIKGEMIDKDGKDGMIQTLRNIETDFNEIARSDQRADISILRQFSYELITSKTFKALMMMAIVINTILMVLPIIMASNDTVADSSRVQISIVENVIGKKLKLDLNVNRLLQSEYSYSKYWSNCLPFNIRFGTMDGMCLT